ncbi:MAG: 1-hydroxycarotenoid 3,4-desaturase CrtD [Pseudomonadota bacterium]
MQRTAEKVIVIGAGMGGLSAAIRLAAAGLRVTVLESADTPGGKARAFPSAAGPVDAGPTVLTLRATFDALFALAGERLDDHVTLTRQPILARHFWPDGSRLDLFPETDANIAAIHAFAGPREAAAFARFDRLATGLYQAFEAPVMLSPRPDLPAILRATLRRPRLWPALVPGMTLTRLLALHFRDPRLIQLFGRYATYVGGRPGHAPGILALIWRAEAAGVWAVRGGMHRLAAQLACLAERLGVSFRYATPAQRIVTQGGRVTGVQIAGGATLPCSAALFNGDPGALVAGLLGDTARKACATPGPPSLSAYVWAFAASPTGPRAADLIHHNLFFTADPQAEFGPIGRGQMPDAPTLYLCAQDRATGPAPPVERFEILLNAPANRPAPTQETDTCRSRTFPPLARMGLGFTPSPQGLTTPTLLAQRFAGSMGAIYGRSPEGTLAAFRRPQARTALPGLYLAGGGAHPGAGVPMAALSGQHAAEAMIRDLTSASPSPPMAMRGGT